MTRDVTAEAKRTPEGIVWSWQLDQDAVATMTTVGRRSVNSSNPIHIRPLEFGTDLDTSDNLAHLPPVSTHLRQIHASRWVTSLPDGCTKGPGSAPCRDLGPPGGWSGWHFGSAS